MRSLDYILLSSCGFPHGSLFVGFPHESDPQKAAEMALPQSHKYNLAVGRGEEPKLAYQWTEPYRVFPKAWGWVFRTMACSYPGTGVPCTPQGSITCVLQSLWLPSLTMLAQELRVSQELSFKAGAFYFPFAKTNFMKSWLPSFWKELSLPLTRWIEGRVICHSKPLYFTRL